MAIAKVASAHATPGINGGATSGIDTTGASLLVAVVSWYRVITATPTVSDSKGNTWVKRTTTTSGDMSVAIWYAVNPSVGAAHTFTASGSSTYPAIYFIGFSGADTSSPYDTESAGGAGSGTGTGQAPGSATPAGDNELFVTGCGNYDGSITGIGSSFTLDFSDAFGSGVNEGGGLAYKIQTTGGAENPTWTLTGFNFHAAVMSVFKAAAAPAGLDIPIAAYHYNHHLMSMC